MAKKYYPSKKDKKQDDSVHEHLRFASTSAQKNPTTSTSATAYTESRVKSMLQNAQSYGNQLGMYSKTVKRINGIYMRIIKYFSNALTFDHVLYPLILDFSTVDVESMNLDFNQKAIYLNKLNIQYNLPIFTEKMFTQGTVFVYKIEDKKGVSYQELPLKFCRVGYIENGVYRLQFDMSQVSTATIEFYPKEIQSAFNTYQSGSRDNFVDGKWYQVSDKGVAFTLDTDVLMQEGISSPPLANTLINAIKIETAKDNMESTDNLDTTKIIHAQVPTDKNGRPTIELPVVREYYNALKRAMPDGSVPVVNPFKTESISLNGTGSDGKFALLDKSVEQAYIDSGVSYQLFSSDSNSNQALEKSISVDMQWLFGTVLPMFANYYNYELTKSGKKSGIEWQVKFLKISHFNRKDAINSAKEQLSNGGSRMEYLATTGLTPVEIASMLVFEQRVLNIDDFMLPKQTSFTLTGGGEEEKGRPESDEPTDKTLDIKDKQ